MDKFSIKGCQIRWDKEAKVSDKDRQLVRKDLEGMSETIEEALNYVKEKYSKNRIAQVRFQLNSDYADIYLTISYAIFNGKEHIYLGLDNENFTECLGEIACKKGLFREILEDKDVEAETI